MPTMTLSYAQKVLNVAEKSRLNGRDRSFTDADRDLIRQASGELWADVWSGGKASTAETSAQQQWNSIWENSYAA